MAEDNKKVFTIANVAKVIALAESVTGSPLFGLVAGFLPKIAPQLTEEQKAQLDANYASYVKEIAESKESELTGRHQDGPQEGDTD